MVEAALSKIARRYRSSLMVFVELVGDPASMRIRRALGGLVVVPSPGVG